jgi:hypothetical protein
MAIVWLPTLCSSSPWIHASVWRGNLCDL